jgi:hypothetical protein
MFVSFLSERIKSMRKFAFTTLAVVPFVLAIWFWQRPPANATEAGLQFANSLQQNHPDGILKHLLPKEKDALSLSDDQARSILAQVIMPAFQKLKVRTQEMRLMDGDYEMYLMGPCGPKEAEAQFYLGILELKPHEYQTSLTNLYLGIKVAESRIAKKQGKEIQARTTQQERMQTLAKLGMVGVYDFHNGTVTKWEL